MNETPGYDGAVAWGREDCNGRRGRDHHPHGPRGRSFGGSVARDVPVAQGRGRAIERNPSWAHGVHDGPALSRFASAKLTSNTAMAKNGFCRLHSHFFILFRMVVSVTMSIIDVDMVALKRDVRGNWVLLSRWTIVWSHGRRCAMR